MAQHEDVINVMNQNGGFATLGFLNQNVNTINWKTTTPYATIRRIVQDERFFFKIRPGLWALKCNHDEVLSKFKIADSSRTNDSKEFNHTYYQGLVVEIGNQKGLGTYVPNQDKNKLFLNSPLKEISTIEKVLEFSYPNVIKRAKTIDVIWFNERKLPSAFFEVEHSTDFQNSFSKFVDLQDFYAEFFIVSSSKRKREFENKLSFRSFHDVKTRVKFMDYDFLSALHTKTFEYYHLNKIFR